MSALMNLMNLMNGAADTETPASAAERTREAEANKTRPPSERRDIPWDLFAEGSEAHATATLLALPLWGFDLNQRGEEPVALDLFAEQPEPLLLRFRLDEEGLNERFPVALGGPVPDDAYQANDDEFGGALAWDDDHVLFMCPRGVCGLNRQQWAEGRRYCAGC